MQQSPFENIFNIIGLSESNEKPMKHGFYNAFALFVLAICCAAVYVLFLILEPFFKPLFWALLVGSLLHPFKYKLSKKIKSWFEELDKTNSSVVVRLLVIPINVINCSSDLVGYQFREHYKAILGLLSAIFILPWIYNSIPRSLGCLFWQIVNFISFSTTLLINLCTSYITLTIALAYIISVYILWSPERAGIFKATSHVLWLVIASFLANLAGAYKVYMFVILQIFFATGFILEVSYLHKQMILKDPEASIISAIHGVLTNTQCIQTNHKLEDTIPEVDSEKESTPDKDSPSPVTPDTVKRGSWTNEAVQSSPRHAKMLFKTRTLSALPLSNTKPRSAFENRLISSFKQRSLDENYIRNNFSDDETALYFKLLFFGCFCMLIWKHIWLLPITLIFLAIHVIKNLLNFFGVWLFFENHYNNSMVKLSSWWNNRQSALVPGEIRGIRKIMSICNQSVIEMAYDSIDTVSSCIVIVGLILFMIIAIVFICLQIYSEAIVVIQLSGSLLNSTFVQNSVLHAYLPDGWEDKLDSLIDNAYTYGREGISTGVKSILKEGDPEKIARVEQQVLEIWDRVYQSWVSGHFAATVGPQVDASAVQNSWDNLVSDFTQVPGLFDITGIVAWVQANVGTLSAIASGIWAPMASNVSLLAGSIGAFTSLLFSGGGAIISMIINLVVFFTTLFYLLASSNALYKPVEVITRVQPNFGPRLGIALSVAINQVFRASFKMALFYGLWTWLIHNLFGAKVVYLPSVRINFTSCHHAEWSCLNNVPSDITYTCSALRGNDFTLHLKDYYTDHILSLTVQNCRDLRVVLDCPLLQRASRLQQFRVKDCDRLEFIALSSTSLLQTPPTVIIENVREIIAFPRNIFKSPTSSTELKCSGGPLTKLRVVNSKINSICTKAFVNVNGMKIIEFENTTIASIQSQGLEAVMGNDNTEFNMINSRIDNLEYKGIQVQATTVKLSYNSFSEIRSNGINITTENLFITGNNFKEINANGINANALNIDIVGNTIAYLKSNALTGLRCKKRSVKKQVNFSKNKIERVEPYSLFFDYGSCKSVDTQITFRENKIDCKCRNIAFLNSPSNGCTELNGLILNIANNNTCFLAPCILPIDIVKLLQESDMCHLNLDPQVMCLLYYDKRSNNTHAEVTTDEEVTEPAPTFYLIRQANSLAGDASAAMTAIDKDDLLRDSHLNMTNRTTIKVVFDSSRDFVETLRSTGKSRNRQEEKSPPSEEYVNKCVGSHCRNNAYDKQKALDFYKYFLTLLPLSISTRVLAAVLGAAPFLGPYLAGIPAALDVWLQGRPMAAIMLPIAQAAPIAFLDAAVYAEIKDGGHPYVTGLAIAGGIFYLGPEGAILGPLLLCCLMVVLNLSSTFLRDTPAEERAALHSRVRYGAYL
ncbi:unnamed protein product [Leptosia nina]|uniref:Transmembrane protein 245 n=1 Tax=Leptosia nina TaxID=320188 RepID=A0AAV1JLV0_9NEOP